MTIIKWANQSSPWPRSFFRPLVDWNEEWPEIRVTDGLDVHETDDSVVVKAAVPGVPAEKVDITFEDGVLRIKARVEESEEEKKKKKVVYRQEKMAIFDYTATLPRAIDSNKITAEVNDGVATVTAPIAQEAKPKKISVKTSK